MKEAVFFIFLIVQSLSQALYANHEVGVYSNLLISEQKNKKELIEKIIKDLLKSDEDVQINEISGGYSGAKLFFLNLNNKNFIIRFSNQDSLDKKEKEILICRIASEIGYGPKIYFSDVNQGIIVMEYLINDLETPQDICQALANLTKKIHNGPLFPSTSNLLDEIKDRLNKYLSTQKAQKEFIPKKWLEKIMEALDEIQKSMECYPVKTPCHRDLHKGNLFFSKGHFVAIDFEMAAQDDPFVDLATLSMSYQFNSDNERVFLTSYFDRHPTIQEESKLYLMKQLISVFWGIGLINLVKDGDIALLKPLTSREPKQSGYQTSDDKLSHAASLLRHALSNFESKEYQEALRILNCQSN